VAAVGRDQGSFSSMTYRDLIQLVRPQFPNLTEVNSRPTSPYDEDYNCIAWAAGSVDQWWWPDPLGQCYWPPDIPRTVSIDAFVLAFGREGYTQKSDPSLEAGRGKVAIYADGNGAPTHAARQLPNGWWASKLGQQIDIEHELSALDGPEYGSVVMILSRSTR
jgi:hypothetical protein